MTLAINYLELPRICDSSSDYDLVLWTAELSRGDSLLLRDCAFRRPLALKILAEALADDGIRVQVDDFVEDEDYRRAIIAHASDCGLDASVT